MSTTEEPKKDVTLPEESTSSWKLYLAVAGIVLVFAGGAVTWHFSARNAGRFSVVLDDVTGRYLTQAFTLLHLPSAAALPLLREASRGRRAGPSPS